MGSFVSTEIPPKRVRPNTDEIIPWVAAILATYLLLVLHCGSAKCDEVPAAAVVLKKCHDRMETAATYQCTLTDQIRREATLYFQRTLPDGRQERAMVRSVDPLKIQIQNRDGYWWVDINEAIKLEFMQPQPSILGELVQLLDKFPSEIKLNMEQNDTSLNVGCYVIKATLSTALTARLAEDFRIAHRDAKPIVANPKLDMLQFIAKQRIYSVGAEDLMLYKYKTYDGNGDLLSEQVATEQKIGEPIEDAVFSPPEGWPIFVAHDKEQLNKHAANKAREFQKNFWLGLQTKLSSISTNVPPKTNQKH